MAAIRDAIPVEARQEKSAAIARRIIGWRRFADAGTILAFLSSRSEVLTEPIIAAALAGGKVVAAPRTLLAEKRLEFRRVRAIPGEVEPGAFGILEPKVEAPLVEPAAADLVLVPGLAFDEQGYRLGYGGGFYDRLLAHPAVHAAAAGLAFEEQLIAGSPRGESDVPVGWVVTERRIIACGDGGAKPVRRLRREQA